MSLVFLAWAYRVIRYNLLAVKEERLQLLFKKYIQNSLTAEESQELEEYIDDPSLAPLLQSTIEETWNDAGESELSNSVQIDEVVKDLENKVQLRIDTLERTKVLSFPSYWRYAAAVVLVLASLGVLMYTLNRPVQESTTLSALNNNNDIAPGTNRATLLLANGRSITLSEEMEGINVTGNSISYENGTVLLDHTNQQFLTIAVPRGGKYKLRLSDGTRVWLNAASSLKYPNAFQGDSRIVEVHGEAYFEVQADSKHPFIVKTENQSIKVLGTAFNVNTYDKEKTTTTLVHGRIALTNAKGVDKILSPGDQAVVKGSVFDINKVNSQDYIAWKDDLLVLNDQDIYDIFKQLERWYDVEFVNIELIQANKTLSGEIPRDTHLSAILQALEEQIHVKFEITGRRIMIKT